MENRFNFKDHKIAFIFALLSALVVVFQTSRYWFLFDLSFILENAYRMFCGSVIYKDFFIPYPPGTFLIQEYLIKIFGTTLYPQIMYCCIVSFFTYLLTYRILFFFNFDKWFNLALSFPIAITGGYGIIMFPFYDPDCTFFLLISIFFILYCFENSYPPFTAFLSGIFAVLPAFFKQNIGLMYLFLINLLMIIVLIFKREEIKFKNYLIFLCGIIFISVVLLLSIHLTSGIGNYYYSVITIPQKVRLPEPNKFLSYYLNLIDLRGVLLWLAILPLLYYLKSKNFWVKLLTVLLTVTPFYIIPFLRFLFQHREYYDQFLAVWVVTNVVSAIAGFYSLFRANSVPLYKRIFIFVLIALINAAFLSQGYNSSTYGLWPMLPILFVMLFVIITNSKMGIHSSHFRKLFIYNSIGITISVLALVISNFHWHFSYTFGSGEEIHHSTTPSLKGLAATGDYIPNLDNLLVFIGNEIPQDEEIILIPPEDPLYFATGRIPHFPLEMSDWDLRINSSEEIMQKVKSARIKWLIIKTKLQSGGTLNFDNISNLILLLKKEFILYKTLPGYEIYRFSS